MGSEWKKKGDGSNKVHGEGNIIILYYYIFII